MYCICFVQGSWSQIWYGTVPTIQNLQQGRIKISGYTQHLLIASNFLLTLTCLLGCSFLILIFIKVSAQYDSCAQGCEFYIRLDERTGDQPINTLQNCNDSKLYFFQCFGSGSDPDSIGSADSDSQIWVRIPASQNCPEKKC
jgi:hypothetical protein